MIAGRGYVFACIQKTATAAVRHWLIEHHGGKPIGPYHSFYVPPPHEEKFRFLTVRDPYERMRSLWRVTKIKEPWASFEHMCRHYHEFDLGQSEILDRFKPDLTLRAENLSEEIRALGFNRDDVPPPVQTRITKAPEYALTDADRAVVFRVFWRDFEALGYPR